MKRLHYWLAPCQGLGVVVSGVLITDNQSELSYSNGFTLLKQALGSSAFGGQGFPSYLMTDDSKAEKNALKSVWPHSGQFLCIFHVNQAVWRWLWDNKNGILGYDRRHLMCLFRKIMYAASKADMVRQYGELVQDLTCQKYLAFMRHIGNYWERRAQWAKAYRHVPEIRGHHTNNMCEVNVRLFKDQVLDRHKAFNLVSLVRFVAKELTEYWRDRLLQFAGNRNPRQHIMQERLSKAASYISSASDINNLGEGFYSVPSEKKSSAGANLENESWVVDAQHGICTCVAGMHGKLCKHQVIVHKFYPNTLPAIPSVTSDEYRRTMAILALGDNADDESYYVGLRGPDGTMGNGPSELFASSVDPEDFPSQSFADADSVPFCTRCRRSHQGTDGRGPAGGRRSF